MTEKTAEEVEAADEKASAWELKQQAEAQLHLMSIVGSDALAKACVDPFDYAMKLRTGEVLIFHDCTVLNREWVHLTLRRYADQPVVNRIAYKADRGVDVRISDIVWVMDAPNGS